MARLEAQGVTKTRAQHVSRGRAQCVTRASQSLGHEQLVFERPHYCLPRIRAQALTRASFQAM